MLRRAPGGAERQKQRGKRIVLRRAGKGRLRPGLFARVILQLCGQGAQRGIAVRHALAQKLRADQERRVLHGRIHGGLGRKQGLRLPRGLVRLEHAEHAARAGGEHPQGGRRMDVLRRVKVRALRHRAQLGALILRQRNALERRRGERGKQQRRAEPQQQDGQQKNERLHAGDGERQKHRAREHAALRGDEAVRQAKAKPPGTGKQAAQQRIKRDGGGERQQRRAQQRAWQKTRMQKGQRLRQEGQRREQRHAGQRARHKQRELDERQERDGIGAAQHVQPVRGKACRKGERRAAHEEAALRFGRGGDGRVKRGDQRSGGKQRGLIRGQQAVAGKQRFPRGGDGREREAAGADQPRKHGFRIGAGMADWRGDAAARGMVKRGEYARGRIGRAGKLNAGKEHGVKAALQRGGRYGGCVEDGGGLAGREQLGEHLAAGERLLPAQVLPAGVVPDAPACQQQKPAGTAGIHRHHAGLEAAQQRRVIRKTCGVGRMKIRKEEQGMGSIARAQAAKLAKRVVRVRLRAQDAADDVQKRTIHKSPPHAQAGLSVRQSHRAYVKTLH